FID
ncbi:ATP-binding component of molybdate transport system, partial [Vibrio harveyi]